MDFLNRPYYSHMRIAPGVVVKVRWFQAAPGAKVFPGPHCFGSQFHDDGHYDEDYPYLGEIPSSRWPWSDPKAPPGLCGQRTHTPLDWFQTGVPLELLPQGANLYGRCGPPWAALDLVGAVEVADISELEADDMPRLIGEITIYGGATLPDGWLWCNGGAYEIALWPALAAVLLPDHAGEIPGTFRVPNYETAYVGGFPYQFPDNSKGRGQRIGSWTYYLQADELPAHTHSLGESPSTGVQSSPFALGVQEGLLGYMPTEKLYATGPNATAGLPILMAPEAVREYLIIYAGPPGGPHLTLLGCVEVAADALPWALDLVGAVEVADTSELAAPASPLDLVGAVEVADTSELAYTPPAFDPLSIAGCRLWLDAGSLGNPPDGQPISTWWDQSGNAHHLADMGEPFVSPTFLNSAVNGRPAVHFSGAWQALACSVNVVSGLSAATIFVVLAADSDTPGEGASGLWEWTTYTGQPPDGARHPSPDGDIYESFGSSVQRGPITPPTSLTAWHCYSVVAAAADWRNYLNGSLLWTTGANVVKWVPNHIALGYSAHSEGIWFFGGSVAELLLYGSALSTGDRQAVEQYLQDKYGLP